jgi:hypothetical protein
MALQTFLYLGYATACRAFLGFQWDNLLLEAGLLAAFLPVDRPAPLAHFLMRALLFKLYFESGLAKWQSPAGDWRDGSAMTYYYQTAPLPTALAWYAHHLPAAWHHFESYATLVLELIVPFAIFGPRRARLLAAVAFTGFQLINAATANYAFFCHLAVALHLFLLDDGDVVRFLGWWRSAAARVRSLVPWLRIQQARVTAGVTRPAWRSRLAARARPIASLLGAGAWLALSGAQALFHFGGLDGSDALSRALIPALELSQTFRVVNTYHLFAGVTRERIEPEFQVQVDETWTPLAFKYKPGPTQRRPSFVAPHQPRVDFLLWFYGLSFARAQPAYVAGLLGKLCDDPAAVATLFSDESRRDLQRQAVRAVRIVFWDYRLTTSDERRATGDWWHRREIHGTPPLTCRPF